MAKGRQFSAPFQPHLLVLVCWLLSFSPSCAFLVLPNGLAQWLIGTSEMIGYPVQDGADGPQLLLEIPLNRKDKWQKAHCL